MNRLTVVDQGYYQRNGGEPETFGRPYSIELSSGEQLFRRSLKVGVEWVAVDTGWAEDPSLLCIENDCQRGSVRCNVRIGVLAGGEVKEISCIGPDQSFRAPNPPQLHIRSDEPKRVTVVAVPK